MSGRIERRLSGYWRMEAANVVLLPALALYLVHRGGGDLADAALWLAIAASSLLLLVGAIYWRAALNRVRGERSVMRAWLPHLAALKPFTLALCAAAAIAASLALAREGWAPHTIAALALAVLAALEYVNYYLIQLQHFDNAADFARLFAGRGFRRAHLARDLAAWRSEQRR